MSFGLLGVVSLKKLPHKIWQKHFSVMTTRSSYFIVIFKSRIIRDRIIACVSRRRGNLISTCCNFFYLANETRYINSDINLGSSSFFNQNQNFAKSNFWNGSQLQVLCRDVEYFSYHRMVSLAVNMPISNFSFCQ